MKLANLDPREWSILTNDIVQLSYGGPEWRVSKVKGTTLYLRSVLGDRFGTEVTNNVVTIKRDIHYIDEPDWTELYTPGNYEDISVPS